MNNIYLSTAETITDFANAKEQYRDQENLGAFFNQRGATTLTDGILTICASGMLMDRPTAFEQALGATSYRDITADLQLANNEEVQSVRIVVNSGGGEALGALEAALSVANCSKQVVAYIDGIAASAAYKLVAGADLIVSRPSALIGSIGAVCSVTNVSKALQANGVEIHTFTSGTFKDSGNPYRQMSEQDATYLQERIDTMGSTFLNLVAEFRDIDTEEIALAKVYSANDALLNGLIDKITTIDNHGQTFQTKRNFPGRD